MTSRLRKTLNLRVACVVLAMLDGLLETMALLMARRRSQRER